MLRESACLVAASLLFAACGTTPEERGVTGAGRGAAGGAIVGGVNGLAVTGEPSPRLAEHIAEQAG